MIKIIFIGKTHEKYIKTGIEDYKKRIERICQVDIKILPGAKKGKISEKEQMNIEAGQILNTLNDKELIVLLDEQGKHFNSKEFAGFLENNIQQKTKDMVFIIGGAYGVADQIKQKANFIVALSSMTFSHQIIRLLFFEQLYRAFTIIKRLPYHHE